MGEQEKITVKETPQIPNKFEVIACIYNPETKTWRCLSAADVGSPKFDPGKHEILEVTGKKFCNEYELIGFKPREGKVTWISFSRDSIINSLCEDIKSLVKTGKTQWGLV